MSRQTARMKQALITELKPAYRAQADAHGTWFVWQRISATGWATHERCENREEAIDFARRLNDGVMLVDDRNRHPSAPAGS